MTPEQSLYVTVFLLVATTVAVGLYAVAAIQRSGSDGTDGDGMAGDEAGGNVTGGNVPGGNVTGENDYVPRRSSLADVGDSGFESDGEAVTCTKCGAENDPAYRYCRGCASELPGVWVGGQDVSNGGGRSIE